MSTVRGRSGLHAKSIEAENARRIFIEEYRFLREGQMSHEAIARRFGMTVGALQTRVLRYGCMVLTAAEQRASERLDVLIERGDPFTLDDLGGVEDTVVLWLVGTALKRGRIRSSQGQAGRKHRVSVYTPVQGAVS
ncbi:hypothetical protein [Nocardia arizonensis]|uniref:hypothetical protein n=1 Tax=Nocardia arizonensis TaxID=1141647 RepID=UPI0006D13DC3|nr:hypothetical protein [Nocardia arizonensis]